jgi:putative peptidoglycan lipid II flippase
MADRLNQLPLGLIGIALGTVLPTISRLLGAGDEAGAMETQNRGMEIALLLTRPRVGLVFCGEPIAAALFGYGRYTALDTANTAQALAAFSVGLPSYILVKVLTPGYYARHDTNPGALRHDQHGGEPCAQPDPDPAAAPYGAAAGHRDCLHRQCLVALFHAGQAGHFEIDAQLRFRAWRLALAALTMGIVLWIAQPWLMPYTHGSWFVRLVAMGALVGSGVLSMASPALPWAPLA